MWRLLDKYDTWIHRFHDIFWNVLPWNLVRQKIWNKFDIFPSFLFWIFSSLVYLLRIHNNFHHLLYCLLGLTDGLNNELRFFLYLYANLGFISISGAYLRANDKVVKYQMLSLNILLKKRLLIKTDGSVLKVIGTKNQIFLD